MRDSCHGELRAMEEIKMSEQNTNLTEIEETHHLAVKQTAMERILLKHII